MSNTEVLYARVRDGKVTEYPVTRVIIENRKHPLNWYLPVQTGVPPLVDTRFYQVAFDFEVGTSLVKINYVVVPLELETVLQSLIIGQHEGGGIESLSYSDLTEAQIAKLKRMVADYAEGQVAKLAQERGYDNLDTLLGRYRNSTNPVFAAEALFIQTALDNAWTNLQVYFEEIKQGTKPLPILLREIDQVIQLPTWESMTAA